MGTQGIRGASGSAPQVAQGQDGWIHWTEEATMRTTTEDRRKLGEWVTMGGGENVTASRLNAIADALTDLESALAVVREARRRCDDAVPGWAPELRAALARLGQ